MNTSNGVRLSCNNLDTSSPQIMEPYRRHKDESKQKLERHFAVDTHPDKHQREKISAEVGMTTAQVKFWFQNKRVATAGIRKRTESCKLRIQNEKLRHENHLLKEKLQEMLCANCAPSSEDQKLVEENLNLRKQIAEAYDFLRAHGVDPNPQLRQNVVDPPPSEVNSTAPVSDSLGDPTTEVNLDLSISPPGRVQNLDRNEEME